MHFEGGRGQYQGPGDGEMEVPATSRELHHVEVGRKIRVGQASKKRRKADL